MKFVRWICPLLFCCLLITHALDTYAQTSGQEFFVMGNGFYNTKKYEDAISAYTKAIQLQPKTAAKAYLNRARAHNMLKQYAESVVYYEYYLQLVPEAEKDRKISSELAAAEKNANKKGAKPYVLPEAQSHVLKELQRMFDEKSPYLTRENGGLLAYYQVLLRTGYAAPNLFAIQEKLAFGLLLETLYEVQPTLGQPNATLDRMGWENIISKIEKLNNFPDVNYDKKLAANITKLAQAWGAYYQADYEKSALLFQEAQTDNTPLLSAWWGKSLATLHYASDEEVLKTIEDTRKQFVAAGKPDATLYLTILQAYVKKNAGDLDACLQLVKSIVNNG